MSPELAPHDLPGTGGSLEPTPAHFVVEEIPLYPLSGIGEHVHLSIRREGLTTREVQRALAGIFGLHERDVGCAGQKDKIARVTQSFSVAVDGDADEIASRAASAPGLEVLGAHRHANKLKRGHLAGNRFQIRLTGTVPDALDRSRAIAAAIAARGLPNAYGDQRLGPGGRAARRGRRRVDDPQASFIGRMELSAWQAELFNTWLAERLRRGWFDRVLTGDVAKKHDTGGLFDVADSATDTDRCARGEISPTGPIYGSRMRWAGGEPGELEREVLAQAGVDVESLAKAKLPGSRRAARVFLRDFRAERVDDGLLLAFSLDKGAYATVALREFTK